MIWDRYKLWQHEFLVCINQLVGNWLRGWWYVWKGGELPMADEPICSFVSRRAAAGYAWAIKTEDFLDRLFGEGHCKQCAKRFLGY